jgi:hypothetical protein
MTCFDNLRGLYSVFKVVSEKLIICQINFIVLNWKEYELMNTILERSLSKQKENNVS